MTHGVSKGGQVATVPLLTAWRRLALTVQFPRRGRGLWFSVAIDLIWPFLATLTRLGWRPGPKLPSGGCLLAINHLSDVDPIVDTAFVMAHGRLPRYLAKAELWGMPVIGKVLAGGGHIPVQREARSAAEAFRHAIEAVERGECVVFYPEGTYSRDTDGWPLPGKNGIAKVALRSGVPVIPVAQWGTQGLMAPDSRKPRLWPRPKIELLAGDPVDLSRFVGQPLTRKNLDEATTDIMSAITGLLAQLRDEIPPQVG